MRLPVYVLSSKKPEMATVSENHNKKKTKLNALLIL